MYSDPATIDVYKKPSIESNPNDAHIGDGETASFSVTANTNNGGALSYQWQSRSGSNQAWENLQGAATSTFSITASMSIDGSQYRCAVTNDAGTTYTNEANLIVYTLPVIVTAPASQAVEPNETVRFQISATGKALSYQWQYRENENGSWSIITGAAGTAYSFTATKSIDHSQYRCVVSNVKGSVESQAAILRVLNAPEITQQPASLIAGSGRTAAFSVTATGDELYYQWQTRASSGGAWADMSGEDESELSFTAAMAMDGSQYRCVIRNDVGEVVSSTATLTVQELITITSHPQSIRTPENEQVAFRIVATGTSIRYRWQYKTAIGNDWTDIGNTFGAQSDPTSLVFTALEATHDGYQFRCIVWNDVADAAATSNVVTLTVLKDPAITTDPVSAEAAYNGTHTFTVTADGDDLLYKWQWRTSGSATWTDCTEASANTAALTVAGSDENDQKLYQCVVYNAFNRTATSRTATLTVVHPPEITHQPQMLRIALGEDAQFTVIATEHSHNRYQWLAQTEENGEWTEAGSVFDATDQEMTIAFTTAKEMDFYKLKCVVSNIAGTVASDTAVLRVLILPDITRNPESIIIAEGNTASFTVEADGDELNYQWQMADAGSDVWTDISGETANTLEFTATLEMNQSKYHCVIYNILTEETVSVCSADAMLSVYIYPDIITPPQDTKVGEETEVAFVISAYGTALQYLWKMQRSDSDEWISVKAEFTQAEDDLPTLRVYAQKNDQKNHSGYKFKCIVTNAVGEVESEPVTLTVLKNPKVIVHPQTVEVVYGQYYDFTVEAEGDELAYQWYEQTVLQDGWKECFEDQDHTASMRILADNLTDQKMYRCLVSNPFQNDLSDIATLYVVSAPIITQQPVDVNASEDGSAIFSVKVNGRSLYFQWEYRKSESDEWMEMNESGSNTYKIRLLATSQMNGYQFRCHIWNIAGDVYSNAARLSVSFTRFSIADECEGLYENILPEGDYTFSLNADNAAVLYSLGFGIAGDTTWLCEDTNENCTFHTDGRRPIRIVLSGGASGAKIRPMLEEGSTAHGWVSITQREHDVANDFNFGWLSIGNRYNSNENQITANRPCDMTIRYRPIWKDTI